MHWQWGKKILCILLSVCECVWATGMGLWNECTHACNFFSVPNLEMGPLTGVQEKLCSQPTNWKNSIIVPTFASRCRYSKYLRVRVNLLYNIWIIWKNLKKFNTLNIQKRLGRFRWNLNLSELLQFFRTILPRSKLALGNYRGNPKVPQNRGWLCFMDASDQFWNLLIGSSNLEPKPTPSVHKDGVRKAKLNKYILFARLQTLF